MIPVDAVDPNPCQPWDRFASDTIVVPCGLGSAR